MGDLWRRAAVFMVPTRVFANSIEKALGFALGEVEEDVRHLAALVGGIDAGDGVGLVLFSADARVRIARLIGQGIDAAPRACPSPCASASAWIETNRAARLLRAIRTPLASGTKTSVERVSTPGSGPCAPACPQRSATSSTMVFSVKAE